MFCHYEMNANVEFWSYGHATLVFG